MTDPPPHCSPPKLTAFSWPHLWRVRDLGKEARNGGKRGRLLSEVVVKSELLNRVARAVESRPLCVLKSSTILG